MVAVFVRLFEGGLKLPILLVLLCRTTILLERSLAKLVVAGGLRASRGLMIFEDCIGIVMRRYSLPGSSFVPLSSKK